MRKNLDLKCPLCGVNNAKHNDRKYIEREHIPPRCTLVNKEDKNGLISVPSCEECNSKTSEFDEKFKCSLSLWLGADTPDKQALWDSTRKTFENKNEWRRDTIAQFSPLLLPYAKGYGHPVRLDKEVLDIVGTKIVRGLHWHTTTEVLPPDISQNLFLLNQGESIPPYFQDIFQKHGRVISKCDGQFEAIYAVAQDAKHASMWLIKFFSEDFMYAIITPSPP